MFKKLPTYIFSFSTLETIHISHHITTDHIHKPNEIREIDEYRKLLCMTFIEYGKNVQIPAVTETIRRQRVD